MEGEKKKKKIIFVSNPQNNRLAKIDTSSPEGRAIERIKLVAEEEGLKNLDISTLANWQTPKTSKILTGAQKARIEDIQDLAYALGSDPEVFMAEKMNIAEYDRGRQFQTLGQVFREIQEPDMFTDVNVLMRRDFPYVMCKTAGVKATRFVKRGSINNLEDAIAGTVVCKPEVIIYDRKCKFENDLIPAVGYWISSDYKHIVLALCVFSKMGILSMQGVGNVKRDYYKGILDIPSNATREFTQFARKYKDSFSQLLFEGEISSVRYNLENIIDEKKLEQDFRDVISLYARLIEDVTGTSPNFGTDISRYDTMQFDIGKVIEAVEKSAGVSYFENARKEADYKCFFSNESGNHETFLMEDGNPYVDAHLIIPLEAAPDFGGNIFKEENVVCLCPLCSAKIENACNDIRSDMIWNIYQKRKERLRNVGIEVTPGRLFELWDIK